MRHWLVRNGTTRTAPAEPAFRNPLREQRNLRTCRVVPPVARRSAMASSTARRLQDGFLALFGVSIVASGMAAIDETARQHLLNALHGEFPSVPVGVPVSHHCQTGRRAAADRRHVLRRVRRRRVRAARLHVQDVAAARTATARRPRTRECRQAPRGQLRPPETPRPAPATHAPSFSGPTPARRSEARS